MLATQIGNELLKMGARRRTHIGFGAFLFAQVAILLLLRMPKPRARFERTLSGYGLLSEQYMGGLTLAVVIIAFTFALVAALYIALVAGDIVSKEVEDGTMRMILSRPISRLRLMVVKWVSCSLYTVTLVVFLGTTALLITTIYMGHLGKLFVLVPPEKVFGMYDSGPGLLRYVAAIAALSYSALVISSIAFMFSCFKMKPATATIVTLSFLFLDMVMRNLPYFEPHKEWFLTFHTASWVRTLSPQVPWDLMWSSWAYLAVLNAACFALGAARFCRRDFKS